MSQQMTEEPGIIKSKSSGSSGFRKNLFLWMLCHPVFLFFYAVFCYNAYLLCMFGGVRRRGSILLGCALFFIFYLILYVYRCFHMHVVKLSEPDLENVWFYGFCKKGVFLFDKKHGYYEKKLSGEERDFIRLKYNKIPRHRYHFWKVPAGLLLLLITLLTACGIYKSGQGYNGKLSWILDESRTTEYITLEHDNLYKSGIQGIFEDIGKKEELPEHFTLVNPISLHFSQDGTIRSFDMFLRGYDQNYEFVDTYLISYPASVGNRIRVQKGNLVTDTEYNGEKSLEALIIAGMLLPYQEAVSEWNEEEYGIYYIGSRTWSKWDENIFSLNVDRSVSPIDWTNGNEITGYSISVFCPDNEQMEPKRYMAGYEVNDPEEPFAESGINNPEEPFAESGINDPEEPLAEYGTNDPVNDLPENDSDSIQKIYRYMIPEQSFDITLDDWGEVTFVSCEPASYVDFEDASFFLVRGDRILYKFPYLREGNKVVTGGFDSVGAVAFRNVNDDEKEDIIVITYYITGAGPNGMLPRPDVKIFLAGENEFYPAKDMIADVSEHIAEEDMNIENICSYLRHGN